jgi:hypothetical protein
MFLLLGTQDVAHPPGGSCAPPNGQRPSSSLAGFQVFPTGRFWVFPEASRAIRTAPSGCQA